MDFQKLRHNEQLKLRKKYPYDEPIESIDDKIALARKMAVKESVSIFIDILEEYDKNK